MKKRIVNIIINWLGLSNVAEKLEDLRAFNEDHNRRLREQSKRIDAVDSNLTQCEQRLGALNNLTSDMAASIDRHNMQFGSLGSSVRKLEEMRDDIDERIKECVGEIIDNALDDVDFDSKAESAVERAVENATLQVKF